VAATTKAHPTALASGGLVVTGGGYRGARVLWGPGLLWGLCACVQGNLVRLRIHYAEGDGHNAAEVVRRVFGGRRRSRAEGGRPHKFTVRFTDDELDAVTLKATAARVSIPHYVALRALETPRGGQMDLRVLQEWTVQMNMLRRGVRRTGQNVNQIARLLNGGGGVGRGAEETLAETGIVLRKLDPLVEWMTHASGMGQA